MTNSQKINSFSFGAIGVFLFSMSFIFIIVLTGLSKGGIVYFIVGGGLVLLGFSNWRGTVIGVLFILIIEGGVRKWIFPHAHEFIYLTKDLLLFGAYLRFFGGHVIQKKKIIPRHFINSFIFIFVVWGLIETLNPNLPNFLVGIFGLKAYFFYIPLIYMVPSLFETKDEVFKFFYIYSLFSIPILILGVLQFFSPMNSPFVTYLGWGENSLVGMGRVGNYPRISGTFSYISGYVVYLFTLVLILFSLFGPLKTLFNLKGLSLILIFALAIVNILMTGSRWPIFMLFLLIPIYFIFENKSFFQKLFGFGPRYIIGFGIVTIIMFGFFGEAVNAFYVRVTSTHDVTGRIIDTLFTPFKYLEYSYGLGSGIGSSHQATAFLVKDRFRYSWMPTRDFEEEPERVMLELGLFGFMLYYLVKLVFLFALIKLLGKTQSFQIRFIGNIVLFFHISFFFQSTIFNVTASLYFWFFSGFLFLIPKLSKNLNKPAGGLT